MTAAPDHQAMHEMVIVGAGFAGLGLAVQLKQQQRNDFIVLDEAEGVGGTWWVNRYPGCACDVPSHLYSLSFHPNPDWQQRYSPRAEIQQHLGTVVDQYQLAPHLRLGRRVTQCRWDAAARCWHIEDHRGDAYTARYLVLASGGLSRAAYPDLPGLDQFQGPIIHSQHWPEDLDLSDQRVAVIGTGASAIQFIPHVARQARQLTVYQRSAAWVLPQNNRRVPAWRRRLYARWPWLRKLVRLGIYIELESRLPAFVRWPKLTWLHRRQALRHLRRQVRDATLHAPLTPDYAMGCKRVLRSDDYYPTFNLPHVELVSGAVARLDAEGVIDSNDQHRSADVVLLGTGFKPTEPFEPGLVTGRDGVDLAEHWRDGPQAYKGTAVAGFPNLFLLMGPNTALGHNSVLLMIEAQIRYLLAALDHADRHQWRCLEVRDSAQQQWNTELQGRLANSQWNQGGCSSWYLHPRSGLNTTLWPRSTLTYRRLLAQFDEAAYHLH